MPSPPAFDLITSTFSRFERDLLLLCAGAEIEPSIQNLIIKAHGMRDISSLTFGLALSVLPEGTWSALSPAGPLRYWRLIEIEPGRSLFECQLRIDERILHFLMGMQYCDERLSGILEPMDSFPLQELVSCHRDIATEICRVWSEGEDQGIHIPIQLIGNQSRIKQDIYLHACEIQGYRPFRIDTGRIPLSPAEQEALARLSMREMMLSRGAIYLNCDDGDSNDPGRETALKYISESLECPLLISRKNAVTFYRQSVIFDIPRPTVQEQREIWTEQIGWLCPNPDAVINPLISQFILNPTDIQNVCNDILADDCDVQITPHPEILGNTLWDACRRMTRPAMQGLAEWITPRAKWDQLILPDKQRTLLHQIAAQVRHRATVYEKWGFAERSSRGFGISALFTGMSGTGKTLAAEVLATDLQLDLYRIDLSQVVSKYIGETEKNLRKIFDAAEIGGAILLFDEADALFGKRSEVKDSHDRYANIEISYLLQRMETYRGLAILTTNLKEAIDPAFLRRIRFIIQFPFPDQVHRQKIWEQIFPEATPTEGLDYEKLSRLSATGGAIRNIALHAAFLAADANIHVRMSHILQATKTEMGKTEREVSESEVAGWL
ncbi:MAG: hypothetical protein APR53_02890 [Methanoculleus sp. SDB]|nr:MAG: hypothetical protein APR53_02890 [Methanoculleus sp. SDB]